MTLTKQQLTDLFNGSKTWEQMAEDFSAKAGIPVSAKMVQQLFKDQGFNLRTRSRKTGTSWVTVIDDSSPVGLVGNWTAEDQDVLEEQFAGVEEED